MLRNYEKRWETERNYEKKLFSFSQSWKKKTNGMHGQFYFLEAIKTWKFLINLGKKGVNLWQKYWIFKENRCKLKIFYQVCLALSVVEWELRQVYLLGTGFTIFFGEFFHNSENFVSRKFVAFCISGQETAPPVEEKFTHEISSGSEHVRFTMMQI